MASTTATHGLTTPVGSAQNADQPNIIDPGLGRRDRAGIVRIRRIVKERRYLHGKSIYKHQQLELTIPAKFKDIVEPFMCTDLKIEARREGGNLIIEAKPVEKSA